jgi:hypothetical protein
MTFIGGLFRASPGLSVIAAVIALWGVWEGNGYLQRVLGRSEGRAEVTQAVNQKTEVDTQLSGSVREEVGLGKKGIPDPFRRDRR